jgi:hypothetical protein
MSLLALVGGLKVLVDRISPSRTHAEAIPVALPLGALAERSGVDLVCHSVAILVVTRAPSTILKSNVLVLGTCSHARLSSIPLVLLVDIPLWTIPHVAAAVVLIAPNEAPRLQAGLLSQFSTTVTGLTLNQEACVGCHRVGVTPDRVPADSLTEVSVVFALPSNMVISPGTATLESHNALSTEPRAVRLILDFETLPLPDAVPVAPDAVVLIGTQVTIRSVRTTTISTTTTSEGEPAIAKANDQESTIFVLVRPVTPDQITTLHSAVLAVP